jgi:hypothetical protein
MVRDVSLVLAMYSIGIASMSIVQQISFAAEYVGATYQTFWLGAFTAALTKDATDVKVLPNLLPATQATNLA